MDQLTIALATPSRLLNVPPSLFMGTNWIKRILCHLCHLTGEGEGDR